MSLSERPRRRVVAAPARRPATELRTIRVVRDLDPDTSSAYLEQDGFEERLASYERGQLHFYRMWIEADVLIDEGVEALVTSTGIDGIESDTSEEELDALIVEEWRALRGALKKVGVPTEQLPLEVDPGWIEWRM
jgi:hypothetical protein